MILHLTALSNSYLLELLEFVYRLQAKTNSFSLVLSVICVLSLAGCACVQKIHTVEIVIPAGYEDAFEFTDKAIFPDSFICECFKGFYLIIKL